MISSSRFLDRKPLKAIRSFEDIATRIAKLRFRGLRVDACRKACMKGELSIRDKYRPGGIHIFIHMHGHDFEGLQEPF